MHQEMNRPMTEQKRKDIKLVSPGGENRGRKNMEQKTRWIRYQNAKTLRPYNKNCPVRNVWGID
jgi:hypothetical protein